MTVRAGVKIVAQQDISAAIHRTAYKALTLPVHCALYAWRTA